MQHHVNALWTNLIWYMKTEKNFLFIQNNSLASLTNKILKEDCVLALCKYAPY